MILEGSIIIRDDVKDNICRCIDDRLVFNINVYELSDEDYTHCDHTLLFDEYNNSIRMITMYNKFVQHIIRQTVGQVPVDVSTMNQSIAEVSINIADRDYHLMVDEFIGNIDESMKDRSIPIIIEGKELYFMLNAIEYIWSGNKIECFISIDLIDLNGSMWFTIP